MVLVIMETNDLHPIMKLKRLIFITLENFEAIGLLSRNCKQELSV